MTDAAARHADYPIDRLFLDRHSPRSFTDHVLSEAELLTLLEAARWAPSSSNHQPWRFAYGLRGDAGFGRIADTLVPGNRIWAEKAAALVIIASKTGVERDGVTRANPAHAFDAGAAWMSLALQTQMNGLAAHAMGGFDKALAADLLALPVGHELHAVVAIGQMGAPDLLPKALQAGEVPNRRVSLGALARWGSF